MIEIAFWGQNQPSFKKASEILKRNFDIEISVSNILKITEYIGKIVFDYNMEKAKEIWDKRANIDISVKVKKGILYIQADGATVNTRIEDENGSTWKENKLGLFFSESDLYKRNGKANKIINKEFVAYVGSVDTFRILLFAKAIEFRYWEYESIIFISDGATWLRNMIKELLPEAIQILDKFHLIENINEYGNYIFKEDAKKVEEFKNKIIGYCYSQEYDLIFEELKKYKDIKIPSRVCNLPVYLNNNRDKIDYSTYEKNGWFVGSGAIESSNKTITQLRLKQAGMRWSIDGANYLIALRCMQESGNWHKIEKIVTESVYK